MAPSFRARAGWVSAAADVGFCCRRGERPTHRTTGVYTTDQRSGRACAASRRLTSVPFVVGRPVACGLSIGSVAGVMIRPGWAGARSRAAGARQRVGTTTSSTMHPPPASLPTSDGSSTPLPCWHQLPLPAPVRSDDAQDLKPQTPKSRSGRSSSTGGAIPTGPARGPGTPPAARSPATAATPALPSPARGVSAGTSGPTGGRRVSASATRSPPSMSHPSQTTSSLTDGPAEHFRSCNKTRTSTRHAITHRGNRSRGGGRPSEEALPVLGRDRRRDDDCATPGDELLRRADLTATRATTIRGTAKGIWPWLAQLGQGRGGFYS